MKTSSDQNKIKYGILLKSGILLGLLIFSIGVSFAGSKTGMGILAEGTTLNSIGNVFFTPLAMMGFLEGWDVTSLSKIIWLIIIAVVLLIFWVFSFARKFAGDLELIDQQFNPYAFLIKALVITSLVVWFVYYLLQSQASTLANVVFFSIFPYLALLMFFIGTIVRYRATGFKVSSLSSQFLEGRKLFWGSQPFHWGILVLFFGHLTAFLFPSSVIAWNRLPIRLLILEGTAFAFALLTLLGLTLLLWRRFSNKRIQVVTSRADILVYLVLLVQVLSGLGVAYYVRWGSSWFASVLTPYILSIFSFTPDIGAVSAMHWLVRMHLISAFLIIGIFPFTRFVHLLVAPLDYLWRSYQVVIWNWNRTLIRRSKKFSFGKTPRNH